MPWFSAIEPAPEAYIPIELSWSTLIVPVFIICPILFLLASLESVYPAAIPILYNSFSRSVLPTFIVAAFLAIPVPPVL